MKATKKDYQLGRKMQRIRKEKGLTQEKLAEKVGASTTWIGYIETGFRRPNLKMIYKIAKLAEIFSSYRKLRFYSRKRLHDRT